MNNKQKQIDTGDLACDVKVIHQDLVARVKERMPDRSLLGELGTFFKIFGDPSRISILWALSQSEMCVCDLCALLGMKQSAVSQQLKVLKHSRIVKSRRDGKMIYYSLDDDHIERVLNLGMQHIVEEKTGI